MKAITPREAVNNYVAEDYSEELALAVIRAYNTLIRDHWSNKSNSATFTQGALTGFIASCCHGMNLELITENSIRPDPGFVDTGWDIQADPGFYDTINGAKQITFKPKTT